MFLDIIITNDAIINLLKLMCVPSRLTEGYRLIEAGAVKIDGQAITDFSAQIAWQTGMTIRVGKHRIYTLS